MEIYVPMAFGQSRSGVPRTIVIRTEGDATDLVGAVERAAEPMAPMRAAVTVESMTASIDPQVRPWVAATRLLGSYSAIAVLTAIIGLAGTLAYLAKLMRREMAIRMALGGTRAGVAVRSARLGLTLVAAGVFASAAITLLVGSRFDGKVFGVAGPDIIASIAQAVMLVTVICVASAVWPMWRGSGVPLAATLQAE